MIWLYSQGTVARKYAFCELIRFVCSPFCPMVLRTAQSAGSGAVGAKHQAQHRRSAVAAQATAADVSVSVLRRGRQLLAESMGKRAELSALALVLCTIAL